MAYSWLANPRETRAVLERHDLLLKHRLGQNFLVNDEIIGRILGLAQLDANDVVYEVGPGIGTLTVAMLPHVRKVVAVEADRTLPPVLAETCARDGERLALVQGDALKVGLPELVGAAGSEPNKLVSNLPYQVAATVVLGALEHMPSVQRLVVMVQTEVADRMAAQPGTKAYGAYTAKLALFGAVTGRFEVGPGNFMPPPHVSSAVVRIDRYGEGSAEALESPFALAGAGERPEVGEAVPDRAHVCEVIDAAFSQRRKTLRNCLLARGFERDVVDRALDASGIDGRVRAETLGARDFVTLASHL